MSTIHVENLGIGSVFKLRKDAQLGVGSRLRNAAIREQLDGDVNRHHMRYVSDEQRSINYEKWVKESEYGKRWHSEIVFAVFKGRFGKHVKSKSMKSIKHEVGLKVMVYNMLFSAIV